MAICRYCFIPLIEMGRGRLPDFCCNAHRQAHYRLNKLGSHLTAERNRHQSRIETLRNDTGAGIDPSKSLRKSGSFLQVDWVGEVL